MDPTGRTTGHTGGLPPELAYFLAATQAYHDETDRMIEAGEIDDTNVLNWLFSLGPNLVASALDEDYEFDENRTYATYLVDKGVPWGLAGVLGTLLDFIEPGPGEFKAAAKGIVNAAAGLPLLLRNLPSEETLWRVQNMVTGRGPFSDVPAIQVARANYTGLPASYWDSSPQADYLQTAVEDMVKSRTPWYHGDLDDYRVLMAAPTGGRTLDTTQFDPDALQGMLDYLTTAEVPGLSDQKQYLAIRDLVDALQQQDAASQTEALRTLALVTGFDRGGAPHAVGIDRLRQFPDDNYGGANNIWRGATPTENVVFNPNIIDTQREMSLEEFMDLAMSGTLPRATRAFPLAELVADAKAGGFTFDPRTGARPSRGFAFSERPDIETIVPVSEFSEQHLADFINRNAHLLDNPEHFIGAWLDGDNVYIDISTVIDDLNEALRRGYAAKQLAVYDLGNFQSIDTGYRR
jgi:hypothetical protein